MIRTTLAVVLCLTAGHSLLAQSSNEAEAAEASIVDFFSSEIDGLRRQLVAPGKTDAEKDAIIIAAIRKLAECKVSTTIKFAQDNALSVDTLLRWQAGRALTEADRDTMIRLDGSAFRKFQSPCNSFLESLPMKVG